jgi:hypothetical protein
MSEETIELHYISNYADPETGRIVEYDKRGMSVVPRQLYLDFLAETEYEPCECNVQGCLSCFLDEKDLWAEGYGDTSTQLWFGDDPATGKQWNPEAVLAERRSKDPDCQWCYERIIGDEGQVWEGANYHFYCLKDMGVGQ